MPSPPRDCKAALLCVRATVRLGLRAPPDGKAARSKAAKPGDRRSLQPSFALRLAWRFAGQPSPPARDGRGGTHATHDPALCRCISYLPLLSCCSPSPSTFRLSPRTPQAPQPSAGSSPIPAARPSATQPSNCRPSLLLRAVAPRNNLFGRRPLSPRCSRWPLSPNRHASVSAPLRAGFESLPGRKSRAARQLALEPLSSNVVVSSSAEPIEATAASEPVSIVTRDRSTAGKSPRSPRCSNLSPESRSAKPAPSAVSLPFFSMAAIPITPRCSSMASR